MKEEEKSRLEQLREFEKSDPDDPFIRYAIALEYLKLGETEKSIELLNGINTKNPEYLPVYYQLGKIYESTNQPSAASECYANGIEVALQQGNKKILAELRQAKEELEE